MKPLRLLFEEDFMKRILIAGLVICGLALAIVLKVNTARADPPHACPCGAEMGPGMGMGHAGIGMPMMAPLTDPKTMVKQTSTTDGVTITFSNPDKTTALQLQRLAQIMVLHHEMMRTQMQQTHSAGTPAK